MPQHNKGPRIQHLSLGLLHHFNFSPPVNQDFYTVSLAHKGCETGGLDGTGLCGCYSAHHITSLDICHSGTDIASDALSAAHAMDQSPNTAAVSRVVPNKKPYIEVPWLATMPLINDSQHQQTMFPTALSAAWDVCARSFRCEEATCHVLRPHAIRTRSRASSTREVSFGSAVNTTYLLKDVFLGLTGMSLADKAELLRG
jgi:hypothetical protein